MKPDDYFATSAAPAGPSTPDRAWQADAAVRYQALFDAASDAIFLMDGERFVDCNSMTLHVFGCTRDQIVGQPPYRFSPPAQPDGRDSAQAARERIVAAIESGPQRFEWLHMRYDGTPFHAEVSLNRLDLGGRVYLQAIVRDVTERKQAEDAIRRSEARYRDLFDKASDGIVVCAASLEILDANPSFARMTGHALEELRGRRIVELYADAPSEDLDASIQAVRSGEVSGRVRRLIRKDGTFLEVEGRSKMLADGTILELYRDVTEARRQEEDRRRLARIETLGLVAGGIAHDFNNILTAALGYVELGLMHAKGVQRAEMALENAVVAIDQARKLTAQLLTFARGGEPVRRILSLADLVRETASFALRGSNVVCRFDQPSEPWPVEADEGQIGQVFHNLVLNARQAMSDGGEMRIQVRNVPDDAFVPGTQSSGPFVSVSIIDRGGGIPDAIRERVFEPYFTTKADGRGLGLATAYRIVQRHGGLLSLDVDPGVGCSFTVLLPARPGASPEVSEPVVASAIGSGRVLVMDDQPAILGMLRQVLAHAGYEVVGVRDGEEAVAALNEAIRSGRRIDLAVLDLTVPGGMGGRQALKLLRLQVPDLPVIVSSGYSDDPILARFQDEGFDGACAKPYRMDRLLGEIARVLNARGAAEPT